MTDGGSGFPLDVLCEDDHLIAVSKPAGRLVIPGRGPERGETLHQQVTRYVGEKVFVVHRLDREASGLVLFAKDAPEHRRLCIQFEKRAVQKTYLALVWGRVKSDGCVEKPLRAFGSGRMGTAEGGKPSLTRYRIKQRFVESTAAGAPSFARGSSSAVLARGLRPRASGEPKARPLTLLEADLVTGRRHQIRVHLYSMGHPILGDTLYGESRPVGGVSRLMLHSYQFRCLDFQSHPLAIRCDPPEDFLKVLESFKRI